MVVEPALLLPLGGLGEAESDDDLERRGLDYLGGVALCLYTATVVSLANILQLRLMRGAGWGNDHLMMASGKHLMTR